MRHSRHPTDREWSGQWQVVASLWPYLLEFRGRVLLALGLLVLAKLAGIAMPPVLKAIVDNFGTSAAQWAAVPILLLLWYGFLRFGSVFLGELRDAIFGRVTERAMRRVGLQVFEHLHRQELDFHLSRRTGGLSRDLERGTSGISFLLRFMLFNILPTILELALVAGILWWAYDAWFMLITLGAVALYIGFSVVATEWRTRFVREANELDSKTNTRAVDSLLNYETVKYFGNERFEAEQYDVQLERWEKARLKNRLSLATLNSGQALIVAAGLTAMMLLAAYRVQAGIMTVGDLVMVNAYMLQLFVPLNFLGFVYREIKSSLANIEAMFALLQRPPSIVDRPDAPALRLERPPAIEFAAVDFAYHPERQILKDVSFTIPAGQKVAVVGSSGSGKSTLARLLFRFYEAGAGAIRVDGRDIRELGQDSLRAAIGVVPQDTVLFNDTIGYNIAYGRPGASPEDIAEAARLAHLSDFIARLPEGMDTLVGERGLKVSGGEKQRIAIARVLLKRPAILIFDEATSSLDSASEKAILEALREVAGGHTTLVIAHRLSTVVDADRIVVLEQGEIVEQGRHAELLVRGGAYARLWTMQQAEAGHHDHDDAPLEFVRPE
ncbi:MAG: ABC transporter ATP-binding protein/permease [Gammaproteobacteria bacterium]|nr:ABC transporter ATP-binding protein/permease [Gammaproteobacteria bacterium]